MPRSTTNRSYALAGGLFLALAVVGVLFFGWGEIRLAFLLLLYCVIVIGFRLDEITRQLDTIDGHLEAQLRRMEADRPAAADGGSAKPPAAPGLGDPS